MRGNDEEGCKASRRFLNSPKFLETLKKFNMTKYYKSQPTNKDGPVLIDDHPVYKEVRNELKKRLEEKDNDIDLKIAAHILGQR